MILTRTPLRISIGGGGTDLPSYYRRVGGTVLSAAIDKYVYLAVNATFTDDYLLKYSVHERVKRVADVEHSLIRTVLQRYRIQPGIEIVSVADIPAGTGLGSSGSFVVGLLRALRAYNHQQCSMQALAEEACHIEIDLLGDPVGKQDQYIAAFGGLTRFEFHADDSVDVDRLAVSADTLADLEDHLLLFFTGYSRKASSILADQKERSERDDDAMIANLDYVKDLGLRIGTALESGETAKFAALMHEHWTNKRQRSAGITNDRIDAWYDIARNNGALGGKLVGAGAGGFLLFYAEDPRRCPGSNEGRLPSRGPFRLRPRWFRRARAELTLPACLVLGGGVGSRMRPATDAIPKPLLRVAGEPFAVHQLRWLASEGVTDVVYSIGYLGHLIREELTTRRDLGCAVRFVDEGERRLGTAGAIRFAVDEGALDGAFFVLYGDSYLQLDLRSVADRFEESDDEALMTVYRNDNAWDASNVVFDGRRVVRYDKREPDPAGAGMRYIDYGLSMLTAESVRARVPAGAPSDLGDMLHSLSAEGRLGGYEARERFFEIGSPSGLEDLRHHMAGHQ